MKQTIHAFYIKLKYVFLIYLAFLYTFYTLQYQQSLVIMTHNKEEIKAYKNGLGTSLELIPILFCMALFHIPLI